MKMSRPGKEQKGKQETTSSVYWSRPTLGKDKMKRQMQLMTNDYGKTSSSEARGSLIPERGPVFASPRRTTIGGL
jgi:hypothetical protein